MNQRSNSTGHLFVAGPSRSGTTLLELVLSSHPAITITPETYFIQTAYAKNFPTHRPLSEKQWQFILQQMMIDKKLSTWPNFSPQKFIQKISTRSPMKFSDLLDNLFIEFAKLRSGGTTYIGNKRGIYATHGGYTKQLFPDAKFIYIFRDPRDAVTSMVKNLRNHTLWIAINEYRRVFTGAVKMKSLYPDDVFIVKYEDLVIDPKRTCNDLCAFLKIHFDDRMLYYYEYNKNGQALLGITKRIHQNTLKPFDPSLIAKWKKNNIGKKTLLMIEGCLNNSMDVLSYRLSNEHNFFDRLIAISTLYSRLFPHRVYSVLKKTYYHIRTTFF